jgi:hypothetical protein
MFYFNKFEYNYGGKCYVLEEYWWFVNGDCDREIVCFVYGELIGFKVEDKKSADPSLFFVRKLLFVLLSFNFSTIDYFNGKFVGYLMGNCFWCTFEHIFVVWVEFIEYEGWNWLWAIDWGLNWVIRWFWSYDGFSGFLTESLIVVFGWYIGLRELDGGMTIRFDWSKWEYCDVVFHPHKLFIYYECNKFNIIRN